ncbi:MAG: ribosomal-processing cysteine protease Prp [Lachnospiraceae bacterium]|nr:ribosomal-processing cysteine protease Prp [Lachnospiraceae bacterium]
MIHIELTPRRLSVDGHAGCGERGKDIVCAAVSALVQNLIGSLKALTEDQISARAEPGHANIEYGDLSEQGRLLMDSFFLGVCSIADSYPEHVKITGCGADGQ